MTRRLMIAAAVAQLGLGLAALGGFERLVGTLGAGSSGAAALIIAYYAVALAVAALGGVTAVAAILAPKVGGLLAARMFSVTSAGAGFGFAAVLWFFQGGVLGVSAWFAALLALISLIAAFAPSPPPAEGLRGAETFS